MISLFINRLLRLLAVRKNVTVGKDFHVGPGSVVWAPQKLTIGRDVYIGKNVTIQVDGEIGDNVLIGNTVGVIGRTDHAVSIIGVPIREAPWVGDRPELLSQSTRIGSDVWIGYGATILSGVTIGDSAIVGAGALVTRDVEANTVVAGAPAIKKRQRFSDSDFSLHWRHLEAKGLRRMTSSKDPICE